MSLAQNLTRLRKKKGLSQQGLADAIKVRQNTIAALETGKTKKTKFLADIAAILDCTVQELDPTIKKGPQLLESALQDAYERGWQDAMKAVLEATKPKRA